jgi:hypothetical protein
MTTAKGFAALRDKPKPAPAEAVAQPAPGKVPARTGRKAITGYFSPELSFAVHMTARKHGRTLQDVMGEALNDWLRKMGESPVGE